MSEYERGLRDGMREVIDGLSPGFAAFIDARKMFPDPIEAKKLEEYQRGLREGRFLATQSLKVGMQGR